MKKTNYILLFCSLFALVLGLSPQFVTGQEKTAPRTHRKVVHSTTYQDILPFSGNFQLELGEKDNLGRATWAHIQLQSKDQPKKKRESKITYDPVGWHNYKFYYGDGSKKAWLMNRGHLVGYQFSSLNSEERNLVPLTAWVNAGNYKGTDEQNQDSMIYYEQKLDSWLDSHQDSWLDYSVTPIYENDNLVPHQIELKYIGLDANGQHLSIQLGGKETVDEQEITHVVLDNSSPNAQLDYKTGRATNTVSKDSSQTSSSSSSVAETTPSTQVEEGQAADTIVYVARKGKAEVYWYSKENMPSNTNFDNVVEMTLQEAQAAGKRHTTKESQPPV